MGTLSIIYPSARAWLQRVCAYIAMTLCCVCASAQSTQAGTIPLLLPAGLAYDAQGNLYLAESRANQIIRVTPAGILTTYAGTGVQGFAGDGGPASAALLDGPSGLAIASSGDVYLSDTHNNRIRLISARTGIITTIAGTGVAGNSAGKIAASASAINHPTFLAIDAALNVFFADSENHLIRRINASSGLLTTVAGSGTQGFSGDGGPATAAALDTPTGLAVDASGNLYLADSHNHRIRRIDAKSDVISSLAGTGVPGFNGDQASASAQLHLPQGLSLDATGALLVADSQNHRIRRIDTSTGQITTLAGDGTQAFAGDGGPAIAASLNAPADVTASPANLTTLADSANLRVRQIDTANIIHTFAGIGLTTPGTLTISGPSTVAYGSGTLTAKLLTSPATGAITFLDNSSATPTTLLNTPLSANAAALSTASLHAGTHTLSATYTGDSTHASAQSPAFVLQITQASVAVSLKSAATLYGQPIPPLAGTLSGVLSQDTTSVSLVLTSPATATSAPGSYPILASLTGPSALDYILSETPTSIIISKAPSTLALNTTNYQAQAASTTSGTPTGSVLLLDGTTQVATAPLSSTGIAIFSPPALSSGTHTLTATYAGDTDFLASTSAASLISVAPTSTADFTLAATGQTTVTIPSGSSATFSFAETPINGVLSSVIQLTVSGLPPGATATFNPAYLPPAPTNAAFLLTIKTAKLSSLNSSSATCSWSALALIFPLALLTRRRPKLARLACLAVGLLALSACGDRINQAASTATNRTYNLTVTATATSTSGTVLQHTADVTLILQ